MGSRTYNYRYKNPFNLDDMDREKESIHHIPFWVGFLVILVLTLLFYVVCLFDGILPTALTITDEADYPDSFISERAIRDLKYIADLGPKVTGSYENEYTVVEFLTSRVNSIIAEANPNQFIELDIQVATGGYYLNDVGGYMNVYDRIQNVVVKLHGQNNASEHSILLNCHFDSVPSSPGASDDGINVAIMLEVLRKLARSKHKQQHNVIFLFNGAEETPLQAAHGYIAHHKWAKESKILINLEAAGSGGKLVLFQTGPDTPWLLKYFAKLPHPYGSVTGEEIFQSGLIPSDTDFRVFRDFNKMVGVDMAYFKDGYRYHTKYDDFSGIPEGSYQHGGDNVLSLVKHLSNAPEVLEHGRSKGKTVFFDVFGWFMIHYYENTAIIVNSFTIVLSFGVFFASCFSLKIGMTKSTLTYFTFTVLAIIFGWLLAGAFTIGIAFLLDILNKTMSWYGRSWFIFGLYVIPIVGLSGSLMFLTSHKNLSLGVRSQMQAHILRIVWTIVLMVGTIANVRSVYMIMILVLFSSLGFLVILVFRLEHTVRTWQVVYATSLVIPILCIFYPFCISLHTFIPMTGRTGSQINPEFYIGVISFIFTLTAVSSLTVLSNLLRRVVWYYLVLLAVFGIFFGLLFTFLGFPYNGNEDSPTPQRHWIMHTHRQFFNESSSLIRSDSGLLMLNLDRNSPKSLEPFVKGLDDAISLKEDCEMYTLCAIPLIHSKLIKKINSTIWIPSNQPNFPNNETLHFKVIQKEQLSSTQVKYTVEVTGPDKLMFFLTPKPDTKFLSISLIDTVKPIKFSFHGRPVYVILYQLGKGDGSPLTFHFTMETPAGYVGPTLDFAVSGRYVHETRHHKNEAYLQFLGQFPDWAHVISWLAAYQSYVI